MREALGRVARLIPWVALLVVALFLAIDLAVMTRGDIEQGFPLIGVALNVVLRLFPAVLLLLALGLTIEVVEEEVQRGQMTPRVRRLLFWAPRLASLLFAAFVGLFALDVFAEGYTLREMLVAFLIHLVPVLVMLVAIAVAWRWEWVGAIFLMGWAAWYVATARGFPPTVYVYLAGLPFVLGLLFLLNWHYRTEVQSLKIRERVRE